LNVTIAVKGDQSVMWQCKW